MVTIYPNLKSKEPHYLSVEQAIERIKSGKSKSGVLSVRNSETKEIADEQKKTLPCVCFSGKFGPNHSDSELIQHSGLIVLDFDHLEDPEKRKVELSKWEYTNYCWISPSGKGLKVLVKIADGKKHREHFAALKEHFPEIDKTGVNPSRLCFESYDPEVFHNKDAKTWTKIVTQEYIQQVKINEDDYAIFQKLVTWLSNRGDGFKTGERNHFVFKLASACNRFGIMESTAEGMILGYASSDSSFSHKECRQTVASAYRSGKKDWNTAEFSDEKLVTKTTRKEVKIEITPEEAAELNRQNIVYSHEVETEVIDLYDNGYQIVHGINIPKLDQYYKRKPGELTVFTGYANMGKSTYWIWYLMMRAIIFDEKVAIFSPESEPSQDFYFELTEILLGCNCTPSGRDRPDKETFLSAYKWVGEHFFVVAPSELSPTPEVIKGTFLSLVIKEGVKSVVIDPFNQLANDYSTSGGRSDKYLETFLSDCSRFAKKNGVNFDIVAHPKSPTSNDKTAKGDYECPDVFRIADGSMWNNKADNILVYHRPFGFSEPESSDAEVHSKKIRRQKIVGKKGFAEISYIRSKRRFMVDGHDYMEDAIKIHLSGEQPEISEPTPVKPNLDFVNRHSSESLKEANEGSEVDRIYEELERNKRL